MAVPTMTELCRPILQFLARSDPDRSHKQIKEKVVLSFSLNKADEEKELPSGSTVLESRTRWVLFYLTKAGLLESPSRGKFQITDKGKDVLSAHDREIPWRKVIELSKQRESSEGDIPESKEYQSAAPPTSTAIEEDNEKTPDEWMDVAYEQQKVRLIYELLEKIKGMKPGKFEQLAVDLLVKMGYGKGKRVGGPGDGGIDGIIYQDPLGLERVYYIQTKRWDHQVGPNEIRAFGGSLVTKGSAKGVFITSSTFSESAKEEAKNISISVGNKVIKLIDGEKLVHLMIKHGVGVTIERTYEIKKLDENYFVDE